ncbi:unnamed protein product [Trifolium pratense]|uniref:Uncharacterized protein n=1 Tax=Trifolium pratense TaxID=57577 RepID=A0ACB0J6E2_TRIPR|nr:unnamed protein product [Trifolium pratense]
MADIVKFVYVMIIFLNLLLVSSEVDAGFIKCKKDFECQLKQCRNPLKPRCITSQCKCAIITVGLGSIAT